MTIKVNYVTRVKECTVEDNNFGYYATFIYDSDKDKLIMVGKGRHTDSRSYEPIYIPKIVMNELRTRAYAIFFKAKKKKAIATGTNQLNLFKGGDTL